MLNDSISSEQSSAKCEDRFAPLAVDCLEAEIFIKENMTVAM